ncbi:MAG: STM3941 family protein [Actinomycetaceae bacterium]|nr:STM3941 family protein [Actinomycetaceae bacterium]
MRPDLVVKQSFLSKLRYFVAVFPIFCLMLWNFYYLFQIEGDELWVTILTALLIGSATIIFGYATLFYFLELLSRRPLFYANYDGIFDHCSILKAGCIKWPHIRRIDLFHYAGRHFIAIHCETEDWCAPRKTLRHKFLSRILFQICFCEVLLLPRGKTRAEIMEIVQQLRILHMRYSTEEANW